MHLRDRDRFTIAQICPPTCYEPTAQKSHHGYIPLEDSRLLKENTQPVDRPFATFIHPSLCGEEKDKRRKEEEQPPRKMHPSHPHPKHYIVRHPGGRIVPLVAVDQLPDWLRLRGVPREMGAEQAAGMTHVGGSNSGSSASPPQGWDGREDGHHGDDQGVPGQCCYYEVQLRTDLIRAILTGEGEGGGGGEGKKQHPSGVGLDGRQKAAPSSSKKTTTKYGGRNDAKKEKGGGRKGKGASLKLKDIGTTTNTKEKSILDLDSGSDSGLGSPTSLVSGQKAAAEVHVHNHQQPQGVKNHLRQDLQMQQISTTAEASQHNATVVVPDHGLLDSSSSSSNSGDSSSGQHGGHHQQNATRRILTNKGRSELPLFLGVHGGDPNTFFCRHWCHHGSCKWGWNCKFLHRMPADAEGLREVGLRDFPTWYLLYLDLNRDQQQPAEALLRGEGPGGNIIDTTTTNNNNTTTAVTWQQQQGHPSAIDLRLMHGRMSALLSESTAMSKRQKLEQLKEMRALFQQPQRPSSPPSSSSSPPDKHQHQHQHSRRLRYPRPLTDGRQQQKERPAVGGKNASPDAEPEGLEQQLLRDMEEGDEEEDQGEVGRLTPYSSDDDLGSSSNKNNKKLIDV